MGLFGLFNSTDSSSSSSTRKLTKDGTPEAPNRNQREHCYEARDIFYGCLDRHNIVDSIKDEKLAAQKCGAEGRSFETNCASTWVKHFKQRRVMEIKKKEALEKIEAEGGQVHPALGGLSAPPGASSR
ncbi:MAG: hypothetical protein M1816_003862 [Peltula sp. TS41687]|nr:MAG: hypothetical protein M1816_003862 [Peltula sp. TS41687]